MQIAQADPATVADAPAVDAADDAGHGAPDGEGVVTALETEFAEEGHHDAPFLSPELTLLLALLLTFAVVWRPAKRAVLGGLDKRAEKIRGELDEANRLKEEAQSTLAAYQRKQRDALDEAKRIVEHAQQEAERLREHAAQQLEEQLQRREAQAMERIAQAERAAAAEVRNVAVDAAILATREVIAEKMDQDTAGRLVDEAIGELPRKLN